MDQLRLAATMRGQKGVSLSAFLVWAVVLIFALLLGFKIGPPYLEFMAIEKQFKVIAGDPEMRASVRKEVEAAFIRRATIENIRSVGPGDLQISKEGDGIVISAAYSVRVPIAGNLSACIDFYPTSRKR